MEVSAHVFFKDTRRHDEKEKSEYMKLFLVCRLFLTI